jgi:putative transposase
MRNMVGTSGMTYISFTEGSIVSFQGENWRVGRGASLDWVELESLVGRGRRVARIHDIGSAILSDPMPIQGHLSFDDTRQHEQALRILECIRPLMAAGQRTKAAVRERAQQFGISPSTAYRLIRKWEQYGRLEALLRRRSSGGRGKSRLLPEVEEIVQEVIPTYFNKQKLTMQDVAFTVRQVCGSRGLPLPHENTIRQRIRQIDEQVRIRTRIGRKAAMKFEPHADPFDLATYPLAVVQVDHTVLDVVLVDDEDRRPIGRDVWITLAFDVFSRMVAGYYVSLDPVGEISTGMCIAHAIMRKDKWLQEHGITTEWPCWGPMDCVHVDNALEFRGKMLRRACAVYGIEINFRPVSTSRDPASEQEKGTREAKGSQGHQIGVHKCSP